MPLIRLSTAEVPETHRASFFFDEVGRRFTSTDTSRSESEAETPRLEMALSRGESLEISNFYLSGVQVTRGSDRLRDGDDSFTLWISRGRALRAEHDDTRAKIALGQAMLVSHRRASRRWWDGNLVSLLSIPRDAIPNPDALEAICGQAIPAHNAILKLLRAYFRTVWHCSLSDGSIGAKAEQNLLSLVVHLSSLGRGSAKGATSEALVAARAAAMLEVIARRAVEPRLDMAAIAAAIGLSERSGHLVLATAGLTFSECVAEARLARVQTRLEAGDPARIIDIALDAGFGDIAHFNRLFRARFGMTPTEMRAMARRYRPSASA